MSCGRTPSKRSVYSRRAASPLSRTSSTIQRADSRTAWERKPPGRRNSPAISTDRLPRASNFLTKAFAAPLHRVGQGYDLDLAAQALDVAPCGVGELCRNPDDLGVADGPSHVFCPVLRGGQDHTAPPRPEVSQLDHVGPLLIEHVLADDADVRGPILDEDGHVGGPADDKLGTFGLVD